MLQMVMAAPTPKASALHWQENTVVPGSKPQPIAPSNVFYSFVAKTIDVNFVFLPKAVWKDERYAMLTSFG
jgi:hypothetical protein